MKLVHWLGWFVAIIAGFIAYQQHEKLAARGPVSRALAPEGTFSPSDVDTSVPVPVSMGGEEGDATEQMLARIAGLEAELARTRSERDTAEADAERFRRGLEGAVAELNNVSGQRRPSPPRSSSRASSSTSSRSSGSSRVKVYTPKFSRVDRSLVVTGKVKNSGDAVAWGSVEVRVQDGGRVVESATIPLTVDPGTTEEYSTEFYIAPQGAYRVSASWVD